ncbi:MAG: hypothetical protein EOO05_08560 [Chitinophagaceae bacterium]|nr:MAG: hypothetical protein EOO05_08560 [Chitinophagaceae bacterium]
MAAIYSAYRLPSVTGIYKVEISVPRTDSKNPENVAHISAHFDAKTREWQILDKDEEAIGPDFDGLVIAWYPE